MYGWVFPKHVVAQKSVVCAEANFSKDLESELQGTLFCFDEIGMQYAEIRHARIMFGRLREEGKREGKGEGVGKERDTGITEEVNNNNNNNNNKEVDNV